MAIPISHSQPPFQPSPKYFPPTASLIYLHRMKQSLTRTPREEVVHPTIYPLFFFCNFSSTTAIFTKRSTGQRVDLFLSPKYPMHSIVT